MTDNIQLFNDLLIFTGSDPNRKGEAMIDCPFCGKESKRGNVHASFSAKGFKCFVCGEGCGLRRLAEMIGYRINTEYVRPLSPVMPPKAPDKPPAWMSDKLIVRHYTADDRTFSAWMKYKPLTTQMIDRHRLGYGVLPLSKCKHNRLIVPIFDAGDNLVGLRGRRIDCDCGKWLVSAGTTVDRTPLYNLDTAKQNDTIWIVENPIDALMLSACTPYTGAATYSCSYWSDKWLDALAEKAPRLVVVAYDNDLPGNGGAVKRDEMLRAWHEKNPSAKVAPPCNGAKLANRLIEAGINTRLYDWADAPVKADIGSILDRDMRDMVQ